MHAVRNEPRTTAQTSFFVFRGLLPIRSPWKPADSSSLSRLAVLGSQRTPQPMNDPMMSSARADKHGRHSARSNERKRTRDGSKMRAATKTNARFQYYLQAPLLQEPTSGVSSVGRAHAEGAQSHEFTPRLTSNPLQDVNTLRGLCA